MRRTPEATPLWQQPWLLDLLKTAAAPFALALVALVVVFKLIRPALAQMLAPPPPGSQLDEVVGADPPKPSLPALEEPHYVSKLEAARALAQQNPAAVASIVRAWVSGAKT